MSPIPDRIPDEWPDQIDGELVEISAPILSPGQILERLLLVGIVVPMLWLGFAPILGLGVRLFRWAAGL